MKHLLIKTLSNTPALCIFLILMTLAMIVIGCGPERPELSLQDGPGHYANGSINWLRTVGVVGISVVVGIAAVNSVPWWMAAITGLGTLTGLALALKYYEEWVGLIFFVAVAVAAVSVIVSLFVKHKGVFLTWRGNK